MAPAPAPPAKSAPAPEAGPPRYAGAVGDGSGAGPGPAAGRALAFAGLGALLVSSWAALLTEAPTVRLAGVLVIALALAGGLSQLAVHRPASARRLALAAGLTAAALIAGLVLVGIPLGRLLPAGWDQLGLDLDEGFAGLGGRLSYPLETDVVWARLLLLVPVPLFLVTAAALAYWPSGPAGGGRPRPASLGPRLPALALLVAGYAVAVAVNAGRREYGWGLLLLALVALWFWGPRLRRPGVLPLLAAIAAISVPVASAIRGERPWIDYTGWRIPTDAQGTAFTWDHSYGPIDWPRTGDTLFRVRSDQPRYWRAEPLEVFDGRGWRGNSGGELTAPDSIPTTEEVTEPGALGIERADFSIVALESSLVVSPGTPLGVQGLSGAERRPDGSMISTEEPLVRDTSYSVTAYVPEPDAEEMRAASVSYPPELSAYTEITLPLRPRRALTPAPQPTDVPVPLFGSARSRAAIERAIEASVYRQVGRLAARLTAGEPTAYDATKAIETHLLENFDYDEGPPQHRFPLASFIGSDRAGYCQQFSGSMALMLRMVGIPARVATGFTPGERRPDDREVFEVTDLDAHSWVEVYFNGIGWVPFDPTPSAAPASSQAGGAGVVSAAVGAGSTPSLEPDLEPNQIAPPTADTGPGAAGGDGGSDGRMATVLLLALGLPAAGLGLLVGVRALLSRRLSAEQMLERQIGELPGALRGIGWPRPQGMTLLTLEGRLATNRKTAAARYVNGLRGMRYSASGKLPAAAVRRAARRELASGRGLRVRLRLWAAMPPGGPRPKAPGMHT